MSRFDGKLCPVCLKRFQENDDIVVCPVCGTPHHRECYSNKCDLESRHGSFMWNGRLPAGYEAAGAEISPDGTREVKIVFLPPSNDEQTAREILKRLAASDKGGALGGSDERGDSSASEIDDKVQSELDALFGLNMLTDTASKPYSDKPVRSVLSNRRKGRNGVSMLELTFFTGVSLSHYVVPFLRFTRSKKTVCFNLSSGIFMPVHQFFRKMDGWGLLLLLITGLLQAGPYILLKTGLADASAVPYLAAGAKLLLVIVAVMLLSFGDYIYYRHAVKRILKVRKCFEGRTNSVEYYLAIKSEGGTSALRGVVAIIAQVFITVLIQVVLQ